MQYARHMIKQRGGAMSKFTVYYVDFYLMTVGVAGVVESDVAPSVAEVVKVVLEREQGLDELVTSRDICIDFLPPLQRVEELAKVTKSMVKAQPTEELIADIRSKLSNAMISILVDAPESDNYFVVETERTQLEAAEADLLTGL